MWTLRGRAPDPRGAARPSRSSVRQSSLTSDTTPLTSTQLSGSVSLITGASRGIGRATALELARRGAEVVLLGRGAARHAEIRDAIAGESRNPCISTIELDLASLRSVREAATEVARRYRAVDLLVNNAGVYVRSRIVSVDGHPMTLAVNHLGPFLLTNLLLPLLHAGSPSRIVTVTSRYARRGRLDPSGGDTRHRGFRAYADSKQANVMFTLSLAERLEGSGVTANCVHPGLVASDLMREVPARIRRLYEWALRTPEAGAGPVVRLAADPRLDGVTGRYFEMMREKRPPRRARDARARERLWRTSEELTGLRSGPMEPS